MANREHLAILEKGVAAWNRWLAKNLKVHPNLGQADLSGAKLSGTNFGAADLFDVSFRRADLSGAGLYESDLRNADLRGADLRGADLSGADLRDADLCGADLCNADLTGTQLDGADLSGANFAGAILARTGFADVDLREVRGLETVSHSGPSTIGIDTIYKSAGKIPHSFLRACGVPENFLTFIPSLVAAEGGIEFYSLFISYSTKDQEFAGRLYADLQAKGVRCWFAPHDLLGGKKTRRQIDEAIRMYDKLLLILSLASMESEWVRTEIAIARKREKEQKREVLFPIALCPFKRIKEWEYFDADIGKDSAREIRGYHIPNFSKWKTDQDAYEREFDKLLKALNEKPMPAID
jgi:uncharacterized protein YjbI with pentapeptide repeats